MSDSVEVQTAGTAAEASWAETENLLDSAEDLIEAIQEEHRQGEGLARQLKLVEELRAELLELVGVPVAVIIITSRERAGLSQAQLAKKIGCSQSMVASLESGHRRPSPELLARIQKALGVAAGS